MKVAIPPCQTTEGAPPRGLIIHLRKDPRAQIVCISSLAQQMPSLIALNLRVVIANESLSELRGNAALQSTFARLQSYGGAIEFLDVDKTHGAVSTVNRGLTWCRDMGYDAILLQSETLLGPDCIQEMIRVAAVDPMIGFVSPFSDTDKIWQVPPFRANGSDRDREIALAFERFRDFLPDYSFVPSEGSRCLLIKNIILREFGLVDQSYENECDALNDLCLRANRCGFRVARANRVFSSHAPAALPDTAEALTALEKSRPILGARFPERAIAARQHAESPQFLMERLLAARAMRHGEPPRLMIDLSHLTPLSNGTSEYGILLAAALSATSFGVFDVTVVCDRAAAEFHHLSERLKGVTIKEPDDADFFDVALKPAQPFGYEPIRSMARKALYNVFVFLDVIAYDCTYLTPRGLESWWRFAARYSDGLIFISRFSQEQFVRRFSVGNQTRCLTSLCSTAYHDFTSPRSAGTEVTLSSEVADLVKRQFILLVGNNFEHKFLEPTARALRVSHTGVELVILGTLPTTIDGVHSVPSGFVSQHDLRELYARAVCVVFPSLYEGFGFPIFHALAHDRVVFARNSALNREIAQTWDGRGALALYEDTAHLVAALHRFRSLGLSGVASEGILVQPGAHNARHDWAAVGREVTRFLEELLSGAPVSPLSLPRLEALHLADETVGAKLQNLEQLLKDVVESPSFRIGRAITSVLELIPGVRQLYELRRKRR